MRCLVAALLLCLMAFPAEADMAGDVVRSIRASWYDCVKPGQCSRSKRTASGEQFNPNAHTCAHRSLPLGTVLLIHYRGRSTQCRVNDRGPAAWTGNSLDMARAVARALGILGVGVVRIEVMR